MATQVSQLAWSAAHWPDEVAYVDLTSGATITFDRWERESNRLARTLAALPGVATGDRIALHLGGAHALRWIVTYAAIHKAGLVAVPLNTRLTPPEIATLEAHAEVSAIVTDADLAGHHAPGPPVVLADVDDVEWDATLDPDDTPLGDGPDDGDLADIMYTSGTTGLPKGIAVRHHNTHIIPNGEPRWSGDSWIHCSPLFTFAGMSFVFNPMKMGMRGLYLARFDVGAWLAAVERWRPTAAFLVPAMCQLLLADERTASADLSSLTLVSIGSAPLPPNLHQAIADRLPNASVSNNYSMTEAGTAFTYLPREELGRRVGSVGLVMPPTEIRIVDEADEPVPAGTVGEVQIHVGDRHREYYRDPEATAATWSSGWLRTGDLGELDADGYLYIRGRAKDVIIRGGNNVVATDVENVLYQHPAVLEAAAVPVPHDVLGEDVGAFVVTRPGSGPVDAEALTAFCRDRLADYKVPRHIWFIDELPRNATGKVLKRELRIPGP